MALTASQISVSKFIEVSDRLSGFESRINTPSPVPPTSSLLNIRREERVRLIYRIAEAGEELLTVCRFSKLNTAIAILLTKEVALRSRT